MLATSFQITIIKATVPKAAQSQLPIICTQNFCFSFNAMGPIWKFSHKIKYHVCTCHPIWRSSKIISLYFMNIRKQKFLILHIRYLCLFPPSNRSSLSNVRGQESEWPDCVIYKGNVQYSRSLNKWIENPSLVRGVCSLALLFPVCEFPLIPCSANVFLPTLSCEAWWASFKLCVTSKDLLSAYSLMSSGAENYSSRW